MALLAWVGGEMRRRLVGPVGLPIMNAVFERHKTRFLDGNRVWVRGDEYLVKLRYYLLGMLHEIGFTIDQRAQHEQHRSRTTAIMRLLRRMPESSQERLTSALADWLASFDADSQSEATAESLRDLIGAHAWAQLVHDQLERRRASQHARNFGLTFFLPSGTLVRFGVAFEHRFEQLVADILTAGGLAPPSVA